MASTITLINDRLVESDGVYSLWQLCLWIMADGKTCFRKGKQKWEWMSEVE